MAPGLVRPSGFHQRARANLRRTARTTAEQWPPCWGKSHTASQSPYARAGQSCPSSRHQSRPHRTPGQPPVKWLQSAVLPALVVASVSSSLVWSCAPPHVHACLSVMDSRFNECWYPLHVSSSASCLDENRGKVHVSNVRAFPRFVKRRGLTSTHNLPPQEANT